MNNLEKVNNKYFITQKEKYEKIILNKDKEIKSDKEGK